MRAVEDVERLDLERPPQHLRRERRAAHAEQHAVVELLDGGLGERGELAHVRLHPHDDVEPAEPAVLVGAGPERGVVRPDPLDDAAHASSRRGELRPLRADPVEQLVERVGELLHAFRLERVDDVVVVDAGLRELSEQLLRLVDALRRACRATSP